MLGQNIFLGASEQIQVIICFRIFALYQYFNVCGNDAIIQPLKHKCRSCLLLLLTLQTHGVINSK